MTWLLVTQHMTSYQSICISVIISIYYPPMSPSKIKYLEKRIVFLKMGIFTDVH